MGPENRIVGNLVQDEGFAEHFRDLEGPKELLPLYPEIPGLECLYYFSALEQSERALQAQASQQKSEIKGLQERIDSVDRLRKDLEEKREELARKEAVGRKKEKTYRRIEYLQNRIASLEHAYSSSSARVEGWKQEMVERAAHHRDETERLDAEKRSRASQLARLLEELDETELLELVYGSPVVAAPIGEELSIDPDINRGIFENIRQAIVQKDLEAMREALGEPEPEEEKPRKRRFPVKPVATVALALVLGGTGFSLYHSYRERPGQEEGFTHFKGYLDMAEVRLGKGEISEGVKWLLRCIRGIESRYRDSGIPGEQIGVYREAKRKLRLYSPGAEEVFPLTENPVMFVFKPNPNRKSINEPALTITAGIFGEFVPALKLKYSSVFVDIEGSRLDIEHQNLLKKGTVTRYYYEDAELPTPLPEKLNIRIIGTYRKGGRQGTIYAGSVQVK